jgi:hypothetical protein|tara:strand:- start:752 stop:1015 length:264 start_codon:yes stop_codon:yes gene_type:complete
MTKVAAASLLPCVGSKLTARRLATNGFSLFSISLYQQLILIPSGGDVILNKDGVLKRKVNRKSMLSSLVLYSFQSSKNYSNFNQPTF